MSAEFNRAIHAARVAAFRLHEKLAKLDAVKPNEGDRDTVTAINEVLGRGVTLNARINECRDMVQAAQPKSESADG